MCVRREHGSGEIKERAHTRFCDGSSTCDASSPRLIAHTATTAATMSWSAVAMGLDVVDFSGTVCSPTLGTLGRLSLRPGMSSTEGDVCTPRRNRFECRGQGSVDCVQATTGAYSSFQSLQAPAAPAGFLQSDTQRAATSKRVTPHAPVTTR